MQPLWRTFLILLAFEEAFAIFILSFRWLLDDRMDVTDALAKSLAGGWCLFFILVYLNLSLWG